MRHFAPLVGLLVLLCLMVCAGGCTIPLGLNDCDPAVRKTVDKMTDEEMRSEIAQVRDLAGQTKAIMFGVLHIAVIVVCLVLLHRTASVTRRSKFLRHLAHSYTVTGCFYVGELIVPFLLKAMTGTAKLADLDSDHLAALLGDLRDVRFMWNGIDSFLSLFASFWLLTCWHLLTRYPSNTESIDRVFYYVLNSLFAAIVAPVLTGVLLNRNDNPVFFLIDSVIACIAAALVGIAMWSRLRPRVTGFRPYWPILSSPILVLFLLWAVAQPAYYLFRNCPQSHWYFAALLVLKFLCGISAVIAGSVCLEERPEHES